MPLPEPVERNPIQTRKVEVSSFRRQDGMWDVEGRLRDVAALSIKNIRAVSSKPARLFIICVSG